MKQIFVLLALLAVTGFAMGQGVDKDEFADILNKTVNFENYTGPNDRIDTAQAIRSIGVSLASSIKRTVSGSSVVAGKYRVLHILGTDAETGKAADIIELLPGAQVNHIDNVRRIIGAYLQAAYGYEQRDAATLAIFITVYNNVHRGNLEFFKGRYKASVQKELKAESAGIGISYKEWAGKTQLVIPLGLAIKDNPSTLASVSAKDLVTPEVVATIRDKADKGIDERKDLAKIIDKSVDNEQAAIDKKKVEIAAREAELAKKEKELADAAAKATPVPAIKTAATSPAPSNAPTPTSVVASPAPTSTNSSTSGQLSSPVPTNAPSANAASLKPGSITAAAATPASTPAQTAAPLQAAQPTSTANDSKAKAVADERAKLEADKAAIEKRDAENKAASDASKDLRASTAADIAAETKAMQVATPVLFTISRVESGLLLSHLNIVSSQTGESLKDNQNIDIVGRGTITLADGVAAIVKDKTGVHLVVLSTDTLEPKRTGSMVLSPYSDLVLVDGNFLLTTVQEQGEWFVARIDAATLKQVLRSTLPVDPTTAYKLLGTSFLVQRKDGRSALLSLDKLETTR